MELQRDQHALERPQRSERHQQDERDPERSVHPIRRRIGDLDGHGREDDDEAADQDDEDGRPVAGVRLSIGEHGIPVHTGKDGTATVTPVQGRNELMAVLRLPVTGDPRTTSLSYEYLYAFEAHAH